MSDITGQKFEVHPKDRSPNPKPRAAGNPSRLGGFMKSFGIAGGVLTGVGGAAGDIKEHGVKDGLKEMFENMVDPFGMEDAANADPCANPAACIA